MWFHISSVHEDWVSTISACFSIGTKENIIVSGEFFAWHLLLAVTIGSRRSFSISHSTVMLFGPSVHSLTEYYHIHIYNNIFMKKMSRMILQLDNVDNFTIFMMVSTPFLIQSNFCVENWICYLLFSLTVQCPQKCKYVPHGPDSSG